jgi:GntR family histidine utilization transcriptional repressor
MTALLDAEMGPPSTLSQRIRADIEAKILSGVWPPGFRIPFEHEFMAQYGCARMTVNKVLSALAHAGLIERRRRIGSFVARPRLQSAVLDIPDLPTEVAARGEVYGYELLHRRKRRANKWDAAASALPVGEPILDLRCRHLANGRPLALEERLISIATAPQAAQAPFDTMPPGSWLLAHVPWTKAEHRISAINADADLAHALDAPVGVACLSIERRTWRAGMTVTFVRQYFLGEAYHLVARFRPQG